MHRKAAEYLKKFVEDEALAHEAAASRTPIADDKAARKTAAYLLRSFLNITTKMEEAEKKEIEEDRERWEEERKSREAAGD